MLVQEATLEVHLDDVKKADALTITDRSTIDMAAYAMAEWAKAAEGEQQNRLYEYVDRCLKAANWLYAGWVLVKPGIPYVEEEVNLPCRSHSRKFITFFVQVICMTLASLALNTPSAIRW